MKKIQKGNYGYFAFQKKWSAIRTVSFFAVSAAIFVMGYITTKTRVNLLTVVAMLGMLPACKSLVNMIMFLKNRGCSKEAYEQISQDTDGLTAMYDLVMTTYDKTFSISSLAVKGRSICGYTESVKTDCEAAEKHISEVLRFAGLKNYSVKIFQDLDKYKNRLQQMQQSEAEAAANQEEVIENLLSISL